MSAGNSKLLFKLTCHHDVKSPPSILILRGIIDIGCMFKDLYKARPFVKWN